MSDFITLACPACAGSLRVTKDAERFDCPYCGRQHLIRRRDGHISLVPVIEKLERITEGVDRHASELAIQRLREDRRKAKERIRREEMRIGDGRRALGAAERRLASSRAKYLCGLILGTAALCFSLICFIASRELICVGLLLIPFGAISGLMAFLNWWGMSKQKDRVTKIRRLLDDDYRELDDLNRELDQIDDELDRHTKIVRRV